MEWKPRGFLPQSTQYIEQDDVVNFGQADFQWALKVYVEEYL